MAHAKTKTIKKKSGLLLGEKILYSLCLVLCIIAPVYLMLAKATVNKLNIDVESLNDEVYTQEKTNESLTMKINELSSFENIQLVVESMGLSYNNDNIKSISE